MGGTEMAGFSEEAHLRGFGVSDVAVRMRFLRVWMFLVFAMLVGVDRSPAQESRGGTWAATFDAARDFSTERNPNGVWTYGWKDHVEGPMMILSTPRTTTGEGDVGAFAWQLNAEEWPAVFLVPGGLEPGEPAIGPGARGASVPGPGMLAIAPGRRGAPETYGAVRFMVPKEKAGVYYLEALVRGAYPSSGQGDTDFYVVVNGRRQFGRFLLPDLQASFTNVMALRAGDTVDFVVGRGADGSHWGSALALTARVTRFDGDKPPAVPEAVENDLVFDVSEDFSPSVNPNGPWRLGWKSEEFEPVRFLDQSEMISEGGLMSCCWKSASATAPMICQSAESATNRVGGLIGPQIGSVYVVLPALPGESRYGAVQFQVPAGLDGRYRVEFSGWTVDRLTGPEAPEWQVLKNGREAIMDVAKPTLPGHIAKEIFLKAGETIEFLVGWKRPAGRRSVTVGLVARLTTFWAGPVPDCRSASRDLAAGWPMEGSVQEFLERAPTAVRGTPAFVPGRVGQGLRFDGPGDTVVARASPAIHIGDNPGWAIDFWVKPARLDRWNAFLEWSSRTGKDPGLHVYASVAGPGSLYANLLDIGGGSHSFSTVPGVLSTGVYQHVALTYERVSGLARFYVDGRQTALANVGSFIPDTREHLWFGRRVLGGESYRFDGELDEVCLSSRAISASEIRWIHLMGVAGQTRFSSEDRAREPELGAAGGLAAWWSFDGDLKDRVGEVPIQCQGAPGYGRGVRGAALAFDGRSESHLVLSNSAIEVDGRSGMTIECWLRADEASRRCPILEWADPGGLGVQLWLEDDGKMGPTRHLWADLVDHAGGSHPLLSPSGTIRVGQWHHVALVYDPGSASASIFVDGTNSVGRVLGRFSPATGGHLFLGMRAVGDQAHIRYRGLMDELLLHERALSEHEIARHFRAFRSGTLSADLSSFNRRPTALPQSAVTRAGEAVEVVLLGYDQDGDRLAYVVGSPRHGTMTGDGSRFLYAPSAGFSGIDTFTFRVNDGRLNSPAAEVKVLVLDDAAADSPGRSRAAPSAR